jgi:hypothetical protein
MGNAASLGTCIIRRQETAMFLRVTGRHRPEQAARRCTPTGVPRSGPEGAPPARVGTLGTFCFFYKAIGAKDPIPPEKQPPNPRKAQAAQLRKSTFARTVIALQEGLARCLPCIARAKAP